MNRGFMPQKMITFFVLLWLGLGSLLPMSAAAAEKEPLPAEQAFQFSVTFNRPHEVFAEWQIAPGYFLYAKKIQIRVEPQQKIDIHMPQGELKYDPGRGQYEVFSGNLSIPIVLPQ